MSYLSKVFNLIHVCQTRCNGSASYGSAVGQGYAVLFVLLSMTMAAPAVAQHHAQTDIAQQKQYIKNLSEEIWIKQGLVSEASARHDLNKALVRKIHDLNEALPHDFQRRLDQNNQAKGHHSTVSEPIKKHLALRHLWQILGNGEAIYTPDYTVVKQYVHPRISAYNAEDDILQAAERTLIFLTAENRDAEIPDIQQTALDHIDKHYLEHGLLHGNSEKPLHPHHTIIKLRNEIIALEKKRFDAALKLYLPRRQLTAIDTPTFSRPAFDFRQTTQFSRAQLEQLRQWYAPVNHLHQMHHLLTHRQVYGFPHGLWVPGLDNKFQDDLAELLQAAERIAQGDGPADMVFKDAKAIVDKLVGTTQAQTVKNPDGTTRLETQFVPGEVFSKTKGAEHFYAQRKRLFSHTIGNMVPGYHIESYGLSWETAGQELLKIGLLGLMATGPVAANIFKNAAYTSPMQALVVKGVVYGHVLLDPILGAMMLVNAGNEMSQGYWLSGAAMGALSVFCFQSGAKYHSLRRYRSHLNSNADPFIARLIKEAKDPNHGGRIFTKNEISDIQNFISGNKSPQPGGTIAPQGQSPSVRSSRPQGPTPAAQPSNAIQLSHPTNTGNTAVLSAPAKINPTMTVAPKRVFNMQAFQAEKPLAGLTTRAAPTRIAPNKSYARYLSTKALLAQDENKALHVSDLTPQEEAEERARLIQLATEAKKILEELRSRLQSQSLEELLEQIFLGTLPADQSYIILLSAQAICINENNAPNRPRVTTFSDVFCEKVSRFLHALERDRVYQEQNNDKAALDSATTNADINSADLAALKRLHYGHHHQPDINSLDEREYEFLRQFLATRDRALYDGEHSSRGAILQNIKQMLALDPLWDSQIENDPDVLEIFWALATYFENIREIMQDSDISSQDLLTFRNVVFVLPELLVSEANTTFLDVVQEETGWPRFKAMTAIYRWEVLLQNYARNLFERDFPTAYDTIQHPGFETFAQRMERYMQAEIGFEPLPSRVYFHLEGMAPKANIYTYLLGREVYSRFKDSYRLYEMQPQSIRVQASHNDVLKPAIYHTEFQTLLEKLNAEDIKVYFANFFIDDMAYTSINSDGQMLLVLGSETRWNSITHELNHFDVQKALWHLAQLAFSFYDHPIGSLEPYLTFSTSRSLSSIDTLVQDYEHRLNKMEVQLLHQLNAHLASGHTLTSAMEQMAVDAQVAELNQANIAAEHPYRFRTRQYLYIHQLEALHYLASLYGLQYPDLVTKYNQRVDEYNNDFLPVFNAIDFTPKFERAREILNYGLEEDH